MSESFMLWRDKQNLFRNSNKKWKSNYKNLEVEKERIYEEMVLAVTQRENKTQVLQKTNKELEDYIG